MTKKTDKSWAGPAAIAGAAIGSAALAAAAGITTTSDADELLGRDDVDLVVISTPPRRFTKALTKIWLGSKLSPAPLAINPRSTPFCWA